eukprot:2067376-Pleurochrysis_carterae.AAC.1
MQLTSTVAESASSQSMQHTSSTMTSTTAKGCVLTRRWTQRCQRLPTTPMADMTAKEENKRRHHRRRNSLRNIR